jgi:hypothetical protein
MLYFLNAGTPYYLDAGTGSMLVQIAVAGVAGAAVFARMGWAKITAPFRRRRSVDAQHQRADD